VPVNSVEYGVGCRRIAAHQRAPGVEVGGSSRLVGVLGSDDGRAVVRHPLCRRTDRLQLDLFRWQAWRAGRDAGTRPRTSRQGFRPRPRKGDQPPGLMVAYAMFAMILSSAAMAATISGHGTTAA